MTLFTAVEAFVWHRIILAILFSMAELFAVSAFLWLRRLFAISFVVTFFAAVEAFGNFLGLRTIR